MELSHSPFIRARLTKVLFEEVASDAFADVVQA
jgi:hypothetical protein